MIIKTELSENEIFQRLADTIYSTDVYAHMNWREKYHCEKEYYGDVYKDRFDLYRTNSQGSRTGTRHFIVRGKISSNGTVTTVDIRLLPNFNHIVLILVAIGALIYGIISGNAWYIVMPVVLVVLVLGCAQNDYYDFLSFWDNSILRQ